MLNVFENKSLTSSVQLLLVCFSLSACSGQNLGEGGGPSSLNLSSNVSSLAQDSKHGLFQMQSCANSISSQAWQIESLTGSEGELTKTESAIRVNSRFILLRGLSEAHGKWSSGNVILDLSNGHLSRLPVWPDSAKRVYANDTHAYFVSGGSIYDVTLTSGHTKPVSSGAKHWAISGQSDGTRGWSSNSWIFVDAHFNLYAVNYESMNTNLDGTHTNVGMAAKFYYSNGAWVEDAGLNASFFKNMPYGISNEIPGSLLTNSRWMIADQRTSDIYEVVLNGSSVSIYQYNLDTWSNGALVLQQSLTRNMNSSTFLGANDTIQSSFLTDGQTILKISSDPNLGLVVTELAVPAGIPAENTIHWPSGYVETWGVHGGVTNWNYLNGDLYYLNPSDHGVYCWDLNANHAPSSFPLVNASEMSFLY